MFTIFNYSHMCELSKAGLCYFITLVKRGARINALVVLNPAMHEVK